MNVPKMQIPKVRMPKVTVPKVNLPKVSMPRFSMPKVSVPKKAPAKMDPKIQLNCCSDKSHSTLSTTDRKLNNRISIASAAKHNPDAIIIRR